MTRVAALDVDGRRWERALAFLGGFALGCAAIGWALGREW